MRLVTFNLCNKFFYLSKTAAGWFGAAGLTSRRVQLKAPQKIKKFVKEHLGKKKDSTSDESEETTEKDEINEENEENEMEPSNVVKE